MMSTVSKTLSLLIIFVSLQSYGQDNFSTGWVVNTSGDTLKGSINNRFWKNCPSSVEFKNSEGTRVTYLPKDLYSFGIEDKVYYKSYQVTYDTTGSASGEKNNNTQPTLKQAHLFLRVLIDAQYSLLEYARESRTHLYLQKRNEIPEELITHSYYVTVNGNIMTRNNSQFIGQLRSLVNDCGKIEVSNDLTYTKREIIPIVNQYNQCKAQPVKIYKKDSRTIYTSGFVASAAFDRLRKGYNGGLGYGAGLYFNWNFSNQIYRNSLYTEVSYRKFADQHNANTHEDFKLNSIKLISFVKHRIGHSGVKPYLLGGFAGYVGLPNSEYRLNGRAVANKLRPNWGLLVGTGIMATKRMAIEARYERGFPPDFKDWQNFTHASGYHSLLLVMMVKFN